YSGTGALGDNQTTINFSNSHENATIEFSGYTASTLNNVAPAFGGSVSFLSTQSISGLPIMLIHSDLISGDGERLDNFSGITIATFQQTTTSQLAAGTYGALYVFS